MRKLFALFCNISFPLLMIFQKLPIMLLWLHVIVPLASETELFKISLNNCPPGWGFKLWGWYTTTAGMEIGKNRVDCYMSAYITHECVSLLVRLNREDSVPLFCFIFNSVESLSSVWALTLFGEVRFPWIYSFLCLEGQKKVDCFLLTLLFSTI